MDEKKMKAMIAVFENAPEIDGMVGPPYVSDDGHAEVCIDGHFSKSYLYTELEKVFNGELGYEEDCGDTRLGRLGLLDDDSNCKDEDENN